MNEPSHYERIRKSQEVYDLIRNTISYCDYRREAEAKKPTTYGIKTHKIIEALPGEVVIVDEESPSD